MTNQEIDRAVDFQIRQAKAAMRAPRMSAGDTKMFLERLSIRLEQMLETLMEMDPVD